MDWLILSSHLCSKMYVEYFKAILLMLFSVFDGKLILSYQGIKVLMEKLAQ